MEVDICKKSTKNICANGYFQPKNSKIMRIHPINSNANDEEKKEQGEESKRKQRVTRFE
jgi:hypothetical protein